MQKLIAGAREVYLELSQRQLEQFEIYYQELIDWNRRINLTAITDYESVQVKHFLDSPTVTLAWKTPLPDSFSVMGVGTRAGLPGLPLKIVFPSITLVLPEANVTTGTKSTQLIVGQYQVESRVYLTAIGVYA